MNKMKGMYVDGFVLPVLKKNLAIYRMMAKDGAKLWKKYGALEYRECVADDLRAKWALPFTKMVKPKPGETIFFSYIVYKSRKHRDQVNKKVMSDPSMKDPKYKDMPMPFDMKRMAYGGFKVFVDG